MRRYILGGMIFPQATLVLGEYDVQYPVDLVLNPPVLACTAEYMICRQRATRDEISILD